MYLKFKLDQVSLMKQPLVILCYKLYMLDKSWSQDQQN